ncbi:enoyl-CoA hydratase [Rhodococcus sp. ACPA4]|uniref:MaoC family dehydratase n=1 Tax=Rhodococcus sp. ACPA4 TaxID=2028571 RepID=UPI000BB12C5A|nr:MaoC family dehydratase [Rhodococcus sp. ACPA4]PBC36057.1 enoyl-CoA hydratase [Rhodococcus sp. ACPA4]
MRTFKSANDLRLAVGDDLGTSDWLRIIQDRIDRFADATDDHQWIHVDEVRAKIESPFRSTIAHGYLSLSLIPALNAQIYSIEGAKLAFNYGSNRVRYITPVKVGAEVRLRAKFASVDEARGGALDLTVTHTLEINGVDKPAVSAETISRIMF